LAEHWVQGQDSPRAIQYLQRAVENAARRYAYREVIALLTRALPLLHALPKTPERTQQEIDIQMTLGAAWSADKGPAALEAEQTYARVRALCQEGSATPQIFPALRGLITFYNAQGALLTARTLAEQLYQLAQHEAAPPFRLEAHEVLGATLFYQGDFATAHQHLEQGMALIDPVVQRSRGRLYGIVPGVRCLALTAQTLWYLGSPSLARQRGQEALEQVQALDHPHSLALAHFYMVFLQYCLRDVEALQRQVDALLTLATAHEFPIFRCEGLFWQGWILALQGHGPAGVAQMSQGMATSLTLGQHIARPLYLMLLAEAAAHTCLEEAGVPLLAEALAACQASGRGDLHAEVYRLQGALLWRRSRLDIAQATACFQQALAIARHQHAKSWELRAATSLARLWQQQGQRVEAYELLAPVYDWFTEGFDTADLQEAHALLVDLGG
jgi:predicted ATPase